MLRWGLSRGHDKASEPRFHRWLTKWRKFALFPRRSSADATAADAELEEWDAGELLSGPDPPPRQWLTARWPRMRHSASHRWKGIASRRGRANKEILEPGSAGKIVLIC